jgi:purine-cytosine permease-like protein
MAPIAILGTMLKNWYYREFSKLDLSTQSKLMKRDIAISVFPLLGIFIMVAGVIWPKLQSVAWFFTFLGIIIIPAVIFSLLDYYDMYRRIKKLPDISLKENSKITTRK